MEASRAATGMLDVFATRAVRFIMDSVWPSISTDSSGKSRNTYSSNSVCKGILNSADRQTYMENYTVICGVIILTSDISLPRSPQPTYTITSELEYLDKA